MRNIERQAFGEFMISARCGSMNGSATVYSTEDMDMTERINSDNLTSGCERPLPDPSPLLGATEAK
jgi:hypothetical protein